MLSLIAGMSQVQAQNFPTRSLTVVVPYPAAGAADIFGRSIAMALEENLKQSVVVENKPGAGGNLGMTYVARSKPDGYTIGLGTIGTQSINQFIYPSMQFDPEKDLTPIALVAMTPNVLVVSANSPWKNLGDVIKAAREAKDKKLSYGTPGIGSSPHLTGAYFEAMSGVELLHVPFKGVSASMPALIGGQIDLLFDNLSGSINQINDGSRVRGIAVTSAERSSLAPNLPTFAESGVSGFDVTAWFAIYVPKGTPQPVVDTLIEAARKGLKTDKVAEAYKKLAAVPGNKFGPDLAAFEKSERAKWGKLVKDRGIQAQ
ncbi:tripartite tricarboxylate transporter substrate binding protein [Orrella sp. NBD-18]|uniref:Tripartite tricarboxylate transporter substrate binding protein n=1 Tax=Sheuella amnicola TaxID=2707330 RepID=A0A6B2R298_9BURK|nr:tripartite tricarboxylate transporter substrate binding protein [Sheuella amnicola]NDY83147.1 tripartite tricarboxylate transporter substrate binding protein [Sheuella amnicola]